VVRVRVGVANLDDDDAARSEARLALSHEEHEVVVSQAADAPLDPDQVVPAGLGHLCGKQAGSDPASRPTGGLSQRQIVLEAAPSLGQPQPISRLGPRWPNIPGLFST
jgi:hypothetical protein